MSIKIVAKDVDIDAWDPESWYEGSFPADITADTTNTDLALIVECETSDLAACAITLDADGVSDVRQVLTARRDSLRKG